MSQPILQVEHLKKYFPAGGRKVLRAVDDVSFSVQEGEILGIVGESGCGKTTCGRTAIGLYSKTDGVSLYRGEDIHRMRGAKRRAFCCQVQTVFQDPYASLDPKNKVIDLIAEGMDIHHLYASQAERREKVQALMEQVGLNPSGIDRYPYEFSGGMRQRIVIAIALAANPDILICDEPTTALDVTIQSQILELINKLKRERQLSVIFITHDLGVVANMADRVAVMYAGKIVEYGTAEDIFYRAAHPYTWALMSSMPDLDTNEKLEAIPGTPPNMIYPPVGDAFAARNKYAMQIDFEQQPPMFQISDTHYAATWLLHPDAPKVEMPKIIVDRIRRMKEKNGGAADGE